MLVMLVPAENGKDQAVKRSLVNGTYSHGVGSWKLVNPPLPPSCSNELNSCGSFKAVV